MKLAHTVTISVFSKPEDDKEKVKNALVSLLPFNIEKEKIAVNEQNAAGFSERRITIMEIALKKDSHINLFIRDLKEKLGKQARMMAEQAESRIDDGSCLFIRLDKGRLVEKGEYVLTDSGNCFHIRASLAAFPKRKGKAVELARSIFIE